MRDQLSRGSSLLKKYRNYLLVLGLLVICFISSYIITDKLSHNYSIKDEESENQVFNANKSLGEEVNIVLKENGTVIKEESLDDFKKSQNITTDISENFVMNYFTNEGYQLESFNDKQMIFAKESSTITLEPNKYYIGEKDGYFAIYKTDSSGRAFIESEKDVYSDKKLVNSIPENDQTEIKTFKHSYDTKEEAKERISSYIS